jgi:hypothetical protein
MVPQEEKKQLNRADAFTVHYYGNIYVLLQKYLYCSECICICENVLGISLDNHICGGHRMYNSNDPRNTTSLISQHCHLVYFFL